jgi:hypothetical protein
MIMYLRWLFSDAGIMTIPPGTNPLVEYLKLNKLTAYNCKVCGIGVWKRKGSKTSICKKFSCYKTNGGKWL